MNRSLLFVICFLLISMTLSAQVKYDTLSSTRVGPGMMYYQVRVPAIPWTLEMLVVDLTHPQVLIETVKAKDKVQGYERTSSMAARKSYTGHEVVGAVNGDFYGSYGIPVNIQAITGEVVRSVTWNTRSIFGLTPSYKPLIAPIALKGKVIAKNGTTNELTAVNNDRYDNYLILFNKYFGSSTTTNQFGTELLCRAISGWGVNDTVTLVVENKVSGTGNMGIPADKVVLSGHGTSSSFLNTNCAAGDTIRVLPTLTPAGLPRVKELIGGYPRIVKNGQNYGITGFLEEGGTGTFHTDRHPRTAVGFSQDSSKLFLVTVDGRQAHSLGMSLTELADFMIAAGVWQAVNLDGGGSTTMVLHNKVMNKPSDNAERTVSNALLAITTAPRTGVLKHIQMAPDKGRLYKGDTLSFSFTGWDDNYFPVTVNPAQAVYSLSKNIGTITATGRFTAGAVRDTGYVIVDYQGFRDSARIIVKGIESVQIAPRQIISDTLRLVRFTVKAFDLDGVQRVLPSWEYTWSVSDPSRASIDSLGNFRGKKAGDVSVIVRHNTITDTARVRIEIGEGYALVEGFESLSGWRISGENIDTINTKISLSDSAHTQGTYSLQVDYRFTYSNSVTANLILSKSATMFGVPDSVFIDFKGDGQQHVVHYNLSDDNGEWFKLTIPAFATQTSFSPLPTSMTRLSAYNPTYVLNYPLTFQEIRVKLGSGRVNGQVYTGRLFFDNLVIKYPDPLTGIEEDISTPSMYSLEQNYPNPFNPSTAIRFSLPASSRVRISVSDILGRDIAQLVDNTMAAGTHTVSWNASGFPSGVYFYTLISDAVRLTRKMILLR